MKYSSIKIPFLCTLYYLTLWICLDSSKRAQFFAQFVLRKNHSFCWTLNSSWLKGVKNVTMLMKCTVKLSILILPNSVYVLVRRECHATWRPFSVTLWPWEHQQQLWTGGPSLPITTSSMSWRMASQAWTFFTCCPSRLTKTTQL